MGGFRGRMELFESPLFHYIILYNAHIHIYMPACNFDVHRWHIHSSGIFVLSQSGIRNIHTCLFVLAYLLHGMFVI